MSHPIGGPIRKNHGYTTTATERMRAARSAKAAALDREMLWAVIGSRIWPSWLMPPKLPQTNFPQVLVLDTPHGRLYYRLSQQEIESGMFDHLERRANDGVTVSGLDKLATLHALASEGWE